MKRNRVQQGSSGLTSIGYSAQEQLYSRLSGSYPGIRLDYVPCPFSGFELDIAFPALQVGIEVDGWEFHGKHKRDFYRDRVKRNLLTLNDWIVLSYPANDIRTRLDMVLTEITVLLCQRTLRPPHPAGWSTTGLLKIPRVKKAEREPS